MTDTTHCVRCGGTVAPDGWCWDCGARQPAFRAHVEITVAGVAAGVSDRGSRRGVNADAMALATTGAWTVAAVADGVSMAPRAERAARVAAEAGVTALAALLRAGALPETALADAARRAYHAVTALAQSPDSAPACTFVAGAAGPEGIWSTGVGDSRAYWLPDEGPGMALTEDDTGEHEALSAWLGAGADEPSPYVRSHRPRGPGRLLLCTDGLWRCLPGAGDLRAALARRPRASESGDELLDDARFLVRRALDAGAHDDITALLLQHGRAAEPPLPGGVRTAMARRTPGEAR
ncbi:serine/threonine protein phosphatase PrpC [Streptomyces sp. V4I23]|uniref:PP2C family protein-serine/threonine phosphatase n=1 Tax=Streptomyces sp. V4I23 TaxID=3042282 RepID=UPI00277FE767|nr:protein phosphatase 2C domain-containing protein [Streptomyces sp. V4I23]MDQ1012768.1 serine/threonine protein phosphatase PrpC [Streptomyces sp. V4I23]